MSDADYIMVKNATGLYENKFGEYPDITTMFAVGDRAKNIRDKLVAAVERGTPLTDKERDELEPQIPQGADL